jgi:predicted RNA-binding Zn-ribbon protein involved in translation (DUF1610 family)
MAPFELQFSTEDPRLIEMARLYWDLRADEEKVFEHTLKEIAARFSETEAGVRRLVKENCRALSARRVCGECGAHKFYVSRSEYQSDVSGRWRILWGLSEEGSRWLCPECSRRLEKARREEDRKEQELINRQQLEALRRRREVIATTFHKLPRKEVDPADQSLAGAVYLLCLARGGADENYERVYLVHSIDNLTPTRAFDVELVKHLERDELIAVDPDSLPGAFEFDGDELVGYNPASVSWLILPRLSTEDRVGLFGRLNEMFAAREWPPSWTDGWAPLWRRIAVEECVQFLSHLLRRNRLDFMPGAKTRDFLTRIVDGYSAGQVHYLLWKVTEKAAADLWRGRVTEEQVAERLVHSVEERLETSRSKGWEVYSFERSAYCPRSLVSKVFFDTALGIGEKGFTSKPADHDFSPSAGTLP